MSLFSFYREVSPEPPSGSTAVQDDREYDDHYDISALDFHRYPPVGYNLTTYFGTPRLRPATLDVDGLDTSDSFSLDGFDLGRRESVATTGESEGTLMVSEDSPKQNRRISTAQPKTGLQSLPVELWEMIFGFVCPEADDDTFPKLYDLLHCTLTCRVRGPYPNVYAGSQCSCPLSIVPKTGMHTSARKLM